VCVRPDGAGGVAEDGGSEALSDTDQAGPVDLHDEVVHQDPGDKSSSCVNAMTSHRQLSSSLVCVRLEESALGGKE